jgi:hypothetical protein
MTVIDRQPDRVRQFDREPVDHHAAKPRVGIDATLTVALDDPLTVALDARQKFPFSGQIRMVIVTAQSSEGTGEHGAWGVLPRSAPCGSPQAPADQAIPSD